MKSHSDTKKCFFYCKGGQTLDRVLQRGCVASICGDIKKLTGHGPGQPCGVGPGDLKGSLPIEVILFIMDVECISYLHPEE